MVKNMNILSYKSLIFNYLGIIGKYNNAQWNLPFYAQKIIVSINNSMLICEKIIELSSAQIQNWINELKSISNFINMNDISSSREALSKMQLDSSNIINGLLLQISVLKDCVHTIEDIMSTPEVFFGDPEVSELNEFKNDVIGFFNIEVNFQVYLFGLLSDYKTLNNIFSISIQPYNYEQYNSMSVVKVQTEASFVKVKELRLSL